MVYGLAMSSSKLEEEASAVVITSDDTWVGQLLKQGLDWDWTGTGLELDWSNLANTSRLMQARAYSDEM